MSQLKFASPALAVLLLAGLTACEARAYHRETNPGRPVRTAPVAEVRGDRSLVLSGTARAAGPGELKRPYRILLNDVRGITLRAGDRAAVILPVTAQRELAAKVQHVDADGATAVIAFSFDARIIDHMLLDVRLYPADRLRYLRVPLASIVNPSGDAAAVFRIRDGKAERLAVRLFGRGLADDGSVSILCEELNPTDTVVVAGHADLVDGETVEVLP